MNYLSLNNPGLGKKVPVNDFKYWFSFIIQHIGLASFNGLRSTLTGLD